MSAADLLTTSAELTCPHGGVISVSPAQSQDTVEGEPILTVADIFTVVGCPFTIAATPSPCLTVTWTDNQNDSTAGGFGALSSKSIGTCLGATGQVQGPVVITAL